MAEPGAPGSLTGLDASVRDFIEYKLMTSSGFRVTLPVEEARYEDISEETLEKLVDRRLLRFEDRLGIRHVELAHDLLTGVVRKSREERDKAKLRRQLRRARIRIAILSATALLAIALPVYYWLAYMHQSTSYYADVSRQDGRISLHVRLSKEEVSHRGESLRVTRQGFKGRVLSVEAINGYGHLIFNSHLENSLFFPTDQHYGHFCCIELSYDEQGRLIHEAALDQQHHMIFALVYAPPQVRLLKNVQRASVVGANGTSVLSSFEIQYDSEGIIEQIKYCDTTHSEQIKCWPGRGPRATFGASTVRFKGYESENTREDLYLDSDGKPVGGSQGFAGRTYRSGAHGEVLEVVSHDENGIPVSSPDGVPPVVRTERDRWGNRAEQSYFDASYKPTIKESTGYHKITFVLDNHGSVLEERYLDPEGKPIGEKKSGCYKKAIDVDGIGYPISSSCLDANGVAMNERGGGYHKITYIYDPYGRFIGNRYFDVLGKPVAVKDACFGLLTGYHADGSEILTTCLGADGKVVSASDLQTLASVYHDEAFDFSTAFEFDQQLAELDPTPMHRIDLEEAALTSEHFDVCLKEAASVRDSEIPGDQAIVRDVIRLACEYVKGKKAEARGTAALLGNRVNQDYATTFNFEGTLHYIQSSSRFQTCRYAWVKLFEGLETGDEKRAEEGLRELQPQLND